MQQSPMQQSPMQQPPPGRGTTLFALALLTMTIFEVVQGM